MDETPPQGDAPTTGLVAGYDAGGFFDEMVDADGRPRPHYRALYERLAALTDDGLDERIRTANAFFLTQGIGFTVYGDEAGTDRIFPFDLIPRIVPADEWAHVERGVAQRVRALNLFLDDLYGRQRILTEGVVPAELVFAGANLRREMIGLEPPGGIFAHVAGDRPDPRRRGPLPGAGGQPPDAVGRQLRAREPAGAEADLRRALRAIRRRAPIDQYPRELHATLRSVAPSGAASDPRSSS